MKLPGKKFHFILQFIHQLVPKDDVLTSKQIRSMFIDYFINHEHVFVKSSSTIAPSGSGLQFTNAGMNQVYFIFAIRLIYYLHFYSLNHYFLA